MRPAKRNVWKWLAPALVALPSLLMAASTKWLFFDFLLNLYVEGVLGQRLAETLAHHLYATIYAPLYLLAVWCALGRTSNVIRLTVTGMSFATWVVWTTWWEMPGPLAGIFIFLFAFAAPLYLFRLFGATIRRSERSPDPIRPPAFGWRPRMTLRNLFELVTVLAISMVIWRLLASEVQFDMRELAMLLAAMGVPYALLTWACLAPRRVWLPATLYLVATAIFVALSGFANFFISTAALVAVSLLGYRLLGYRLEQGGSHRVKNTLLPSLKSLTPAA